MSPAPCWNWERNACDGILCFKQAFSKDATTTEIWNSVQESALPSTLVSRTPGSIWNHSSLHSDLNLLQGWRVIMIFFSGTLKIIPIFCGLSFHLIYGWKKKGVGLLSVKYCMLFTWQTLIPYSPSLSTQAIVHMLCKRHWKKRQVCVAFAFNLMRRPKWI